MILLIDNYDSFVHNLARQFRLLGQPTEVVRNDATTIEAVRELKPDAIVISPGPGRPDEAGISMEIVKSLQDEVPILGVCLGHQVIGEVFGASVREAPQIMHGQTSEVSHLGEGLFADLAPQLVVCRYHSLVIDPNSIDPNNIDPNNIDPNSIDTNSVDDIKLIPTAWTVDGSIMAVRHRDKPIYGVQFHPEAILTESGPALLKNFLKLACIQTD